MIAQPIENHGQPNEFAMYFTQSQLDLLNGQLNEGGLAPLDTLEDDERRACCRILLQAFVTSQRARVRCQDENGEWFDSLLQGIPANLAEEEWTGFDPDYAEVSYTFYRILPADEQWVGNPTTTIEELQVMFKGAKLIHKYNFTPPNLAF